MGVVQIQNACKELDMCDYCVRENSSDKLLVDLG